LRDLGATILFEHAQWAGFDTRNDHQLYRLATTLLRAGAVPTSIETFLECVDINPGKWTCSYRTGKSRHRQIGQEVLKNAELQTRLEAFEKLSMIPHGLGMDSSLKDMEEEIKTAMIQDGQQTLPSWLLESYQDSLLQNECYQQGHQRKIIACISSSVEAIFWNMSRHIPHNRRLVVYASKPPQLTHLKLVDSLYSLGLNILAMNHVDGVRPVLRYYYALLHLRLKYQYDRALALLDDAVADMKATSLDDAYLKLRYISEIELETFYLIDGLALSKTETSGEAALYINHFEALAERVKQRSLELDLAAIVLAVWYRVRGNAELSRRFVRDAVLHAIRTVSDSKLMKMLSKLWTDGICLLTH
jgi:hypothetical protein